MVRKDSLAAGLFRRLYLAFPGPCCTVSLRGLKDRACRELKVKLLAEGQGVRCARGDSGHCTELVDGRILKTYCQRWTAQLTCLSRNGCDLSI